MQGNARPQVTYEGKSYAVGNDESVLDALVRGGANVVFSCKRGSCHTCMLRVVEGEVANETTRGIAPELVESGHFLPCQCRPETDLSIAPADLRSLTYQAMLAEREEIAPDLFRLRLELLTTFAWRPGQYIEVIRPGGEARSYSIASIGDIDYFLDIVVRRYADGALSPWLSEALSPGDTLDLRGPFGACSAASAPDDGPVLLAGTGAGVPMLVGIARDLLTADPEREVHILAGAKTVADAAQLVGALGELRETPPNLRVTLCSHNADPASPFKLGSVVADAHRGRITHAFENQPTLADSVTLYLCGNPQMVEDMRVAAIGRGVRRERILADPFESAGPLQPRDHQKLEATSTDPELWEALEHGRLLRRILESFYDEVYEDARLSPYFHNVTKERAIAKQYEFLAHYLGGTDYYFGLKPFNAHHWMVISDDLFDYREEIFDRHVRMFGLPEEMLRRWSAFQERFRAEIVKKAARGLIVDGVEHLHEGFSDEILDVGTVCDGCGGEINTGETARLHKRTGRLFCSSCNAADAVNEVGAPG